MLKASLAHAKAHLSELVDQAEHKRRRILILRHGKPAAAIVPVEVAVPKRKRPRRNEDDVAQSVQDFVDEFSRAEPAVSAAADLVKGRR